MHVQVFTGWRYRPGVRASLAAKAMGSNPDGHGPARRTGPARAPARNGDRRSRHGRRRSGSGKTRPPGRAYEAGRTPETLARLSEEIDESATVERTYDALFFGCRIDRAVQVSAPG